MAAAPRMKAAKGAARIRRPTSRPQDQLKAASKAPAPPVQPQTPRRNLLAGITPGADDEQTPTDVAVSYLKAVVAATRAEQAGVYFRNEETRQIEALSFWGEPSVDHRQTWERLQFQSREDKTTLVADGHWIVPMKRRRVFEGVLIVSGIQDTKRGAARLRTLLESVASRLAFALNHARLAQKYRQKVQRIQQLEEVSEILTSPLQEHDALERALAAALRLVEAESGLLLLWNEHANELTVAAAVGLGNNALNELRLAPDRTLAGMIARKGMPVMVNEAPPGTRVDQDMDRLTGVTTRNLLGVPIRARARTLGLVQAMNKRDGRRFSNWDLIELTSLSHQMAIALENSRLIRNSQETIDRLRKLQEISAVLNSSLKQAEIRTRAIEGATALMDAEAGSLLLLDEASGELYFEVALGEKGEGVRQLRLKMGEGIAGHVAQTGEPLIVNDAQHDARFSGLADRKTGFRTRNMVCVPVKARAKLLGVLQALNKRGGGVFSEADLQDFVSLGHQVGIAIENANLYEEINQLFEGFISASVTAIESRDPTTSGHSGRVATLTCGLAQAVDRCERGPLAAVTFSDDQMKEIRYAAVLHDFGKVGVREHVLVKAQKLLPGDLALLKSRFDLIKQSWQVRSLRQKVEMLLSGDRRAAAEVLADIDRELAQRIEEADDMLQFLMACNRPTVLPDAGFERLQDIAKLSHDVLGQSRPYLTPEEVITLSIPKGSLTAQERVEIQSHVTHTYRFLSTIPWTKALKNVPLIAYGHHETLDGTGYPRQISADSIPVQTRMMTICDIYDALTASDRPYKAAVPSGDALDILKAEVKQRKIDGHLFELFVDAKIYRGL